MAKRPSILLRGARLLVSTPTRAIRGSAALIEDGRVVRVGKTGEVLKAASRCEYDIDCRHSIVIPGLVNCHVHFAQAPLRGFVPDDVRLIAWLRDYVWPLQGNFTPEDGEASAELCFLEMLKTGTTAFVETLLHSRYGIDGIAEAAIKAGIRAYLAKSFMDLPSYATFENVMHEGTVETRDKCVGEFKRLHNRWDGAAGGRIRVWIGLRTPGAVSDELSREAAELAEEYGSGIVMHLAEVEEDLDYFRSRGTTPAAS